MRYLILLLSIILTLQAQDWPVFRGDTRLSGVANAQIVKEPKLRFTFTTGKKIASSPVIANGVIYVGSADKQLYAIATNGKKLWSFLSSNAFEAPPFVLGETVYAGSADGEFYALNAKTGALQWKHTTDGAIMGSANSITHNGETLIIVGSYDNMLYALSAKTGRVVWSYETDNYINGAPAIDNGRIVFGGCDGMLHVLTSAGKSNAAIAVESYIAASPCLDGNRAYAGNYGNKLIAADLVKKKIVWQFGDEKDGAPFFSSPATDGTSVIAGSRDNALYCVNAANGKKTWSFISRGNMDASPVIAGDAVLAPSMDGTFYILSLAKGAVRWSYDTGSHISASPAVGEGLIIIAAENGIVYAFDGALPAVQKKQGKTK
ncbi:MAG: PQQ-binding-like beta-propeller repeat protein [Spirochaetes bacterium]|nr:PQQ-binding-like beta-propeller repeat protein [Spirochaetota bacterium]